MSAECISIGSSFMNLNFMGKKVHDDPRMPRRMPKLIVPAAEFCGQPTYTLKTSDGSQYRCFNVAEVMRGDFHDRRVFVSIDFTHMLLARGLTKTCFRVDRIRAWRMYHQEIMQQSRAIDVKIMVAGSKTNVSYVFRRIQANLQMPPLVPVQLPTVVKKPIVPAADLVKKPEPKIVRTWACATITSTGDLKVYSSRYATEEACKADMAELAKKSMSIVVKLELQERCVPAITLTWK